MIRSLAALLISAGCIACDQNEPARSASDTNRELEYRAITLRSSEDNVYAESDEDQQHASRVESLVLAIDRAIDNDSLRVSQTAKTPRGYEPMLSSGAAPDSAILVLGMVTGPAGDTVAIVESPINQYGIRESLLMHYFGPDGMTVAVLKSYDYPDNGCAETVVVELQWILQAGRSVQHKRRLIDQDHHDIDPERCVLGVGDSVIAHPSRAAYKQARR